MIWKTRILAALSLVGSGLARALGGWDSALMALVVFIVLDYATGLVVAGVFKASPKSASGALESRAGLKGLFRKAAILLCVLVAEMLDRVLGADYVRTTVCIFFIANESLSVLENFGLMGLPYPQFLKNMLDALKEKSSKREK